MNWMDVPSPVGTLRLVGEGEYVTGIYFPDGRHLPQNWGEPARLPVLTETERWLARDFAGQQPEVLLPVRLDGTAFQRAVWGILSDIPYGRTMTYGQIAKQLERRWERPVAAQAVGQAVGRNPVSILVPCHRILGANNTLTGYGGGLWRKEFLLQLENISYRNN